MILNPMKFTANFKTISSYTHCGVQYGETISSYTHCGVQYAGESITPLNLRISIHKEENQNVKFLLIITRMFVKMQRFQFISLKSYQKMVMKIE